VLLRGLGRSQGHWGDFVTHLRAAWPEAQVETPDLPGCGTRHAERAPSDVAGTLAAVREAVRPGGPVSVLGVSLGGMVAHAWARRYPDDVASLVMVNSSLGGLSPPWRRLRLAAVWRLVAIALTADPLARERRIHALTSNRPERAPELAQTWAALAQRQPLRRSNAARQLLAAASYRAEPLVRVPLLVLASATDGMVDPSASRAIARSVPGSTLIEHDSAGHDLPLDEPDWVIDRIAAWLAAGGADRRVLPSSNRFQR
jgi:pimeloyl-ACP methyl ester carboxylesterase